jgi:predicted Zn-dependent protease
VEPLEVCSNTTNPEIERKQNEIQGLIEENAYKSAYRQLKSLREDSIANARTYFMLGQVQKKLGQTTKAKQSLTLASAYDCSLWRGGPVFNNIMRQEAKENNISLVDFDQIVNQQYGRNVLFLDDSYPQNIFYRAFTLELSKIVKKEFNL